MVEGGVVLPEIRWGFHTTRRSIKQALAKKKRGKERVTNRGAGPAIVSGRAVSC